MKNKLFFKYLKPYALLICFLFLLIIVSTVAQLFIPIISGNAIDYITDQNYNKALFCVLLILTFILVSMIFQYFFELLTSNFVQSFSKKLRDDLFHKYNKIEVYYLDLKDKGDLLLREISDVENITNGFISGFKQAIQGVVSIIMIVVYMFVLNWLLALLIILLTPLSVFFSVFIAKKCGKYFTIQAKYTAELSSFSLESLNNIKTTNSFNYQDIRIKKFIDIDNNLYKSGQKAQFYSTWINPTTRLVNSITYALVLLLGCFIILQQDTFSIISISLTVGGLQTLLLYANSYAKPFNDISSTVTELENANASLNRIFEILSIKDIDENGGKLVEDIKEVNFNDVVFSYDGSKKILDGISFDIKQSQKIAIVGKTGCGKTTLINLFMRFYDINSGNILLNSKNYKEIERKELRKNIGMVLQDTWIFHGTVLENITFGNDCNDMNRIVEACKKLEAYNFISNLKDGFNTQITDNSILSAGEMQLLCILRIYLKNPSFIILDEATSNIDALTELKINNAFDRILKNKTSIVIAHRLQTIKQSDLILVLDKGKIIEMGNHKQLLDKKGYYYELYNTQYK